MRKATIPKTKKPKAASKPPPTSDEHDFSGDVADPAAVEGGLGVVLVPHEGRTRPRRAEIGSKRKPQEKEPTDYTGALAEPLERISRARIRGESVEEYNSRINAAEQQLLEAKVAKYILLFREFSIDPREPSAWVLLARFLAERHVPGLQYVSLRKRGQPKRSPAADYELYCEVRDELRAIAAESSSGIASRRGNLAKVYRTIAARRMRTRGTDNPLARKNSSALFAEANAIRRDFDRVERRGDARFLDLLKENDPFAFEAVFRSLPPATRKPPRTGG